MVSTTDKTRRDGPFTNGFLVEKVVVLLLLLAFLGSIALVLKPFVVALLFGSIIAIAAWPLRRRLTALGLSTGAAATLLLIGIIAVVAAPIAALAPGLAEQVGSTFEMGARWVASSPRPPEWLRSIPLVGDNVYNWWRDVFGTGAPLRTMLAPYAETARGAFVAAAAGVGESVLQLVLALAIATMFWARGDVLAQLIVRLLDRLGGDQLSRLAVLSANAVRGVFYGVVGTALVQAFLMGAGLAVAGAPAAVPLGFVTLLLAVSQIGAPLVNLVWIGAAYYLYATDGVTLAFWFMVGWGIMVGMLDNVLKPMLIGATVDLPLTLIIVGVFGGFVSFGFLGLFIGPVLIAIAYALLDAWLGGAAETPGRA